VKWVDRRGPRRKEDEDLAERMVGGVRVGRRPDQVTEKADDNPSRLPESPHGDRERRFP
jgi:hypothetical protein